MFVSVGLLCAARRKLATLTAGLDCCMATAAWDNGALPSVALTNQFALFKFTTKNTDGSEERSVSALTITVSATDDYKFASQDYVITPEAAATAFYVALPAASEKSVNFVATGSATITATAGGKSAACAVTVEAATVAVTSITLNKTTATITVGNTETLTATVAPDTATDKTVTWTSSAPAVATVEDGVVTAVAAGSATITATAGGKSAACAVTVEAATVAVTSITLNKTTATITVGNTETLTATVAPDTATDKTVTWTSDNTDAATVDSSGVVSAVAEGTAHIRATANDGSNVYGECTVTVEAATVAVTSITLNKTETTIAIGATETLSVTAVAPENATDKTYTWKTSDASKATVDQDGKVTAVAEGTVTIYAEANDGSGVKGNCTVTVTSATPEYYNKLTKINDNFSDQVYLLKQLGRGRQAYNSSLTAAQAYALATYQAAIDGKAVYVIMSSQDNGYEIHYALSTDAAATEHTAALYDLCSESNTVRMYYVAQ